MNTKLAVKQNVDEVPPGFTGPAMIELHPRTTPIRV